MHLTQRWPKGSNFIFFKEKMKGKVLQHFMKKPPPLFQISLCVPDTEMQWWMSPPTHYHGMTPPLLLSGSLAPVCWYYLFARVGLCPIGACGRGTFEERGFQYQSGSNYRHTLMLHSFESLILCSHQTVQEFCKLKGKNTNVIIPLTKATMALSISIITLRRETLTLNVIFISRFKYYNQFT